LSRSDFGLLPLVMLVAGLAIYRKVAPPPPGEDRRLRFGGLRRWSPARTRTHLSVVRSLRAKQRNRETSLVISG